jgi:hypothetical protein
VSEFGHRIRQYVEREILAAYQPKREGDQISPSLTWNGHTYLDKHQWFNMFARIGTCSFGTFVSITSWTGSVR